MAFRLTVLAAGTTSHQALSRRRERCCRTVHRYERRVSARLRPRSLPIGIIHGISANPASRRERHRRKKTMLKTFAAALLAASMLTAPAFAQGTAPAPTAPATQATKTAVTKDSAVKVVKANKHAVKKHAHVRKHLRHV